MGLEIILKKVVAVYTPALFEAKPFKGAGDPRYTGTFLIAQGSEVDEQILKASQEVGKEAFGKTWDAKWKEWKLATGKHFYTSGDIKEQEWAQGMNIVAAHRYVDRGAPKIVNTDPKQDVTAESGIIYGGCIVNAKIEIWPQTKDYPGIRSTLVAVQFVADGEAIGGGGRATASGFDDLSTEDDMMAGF